MASDESKPVTRGKAPAKASLPGLPGSATPAKRIVKAKAPAEAAAKPTPPITPSLVAAAVADVPAPTPAPIAALSIPVTPEPTVADVPAPRAKPETTNPQPTAPVDSAANLQKDETMEATIQDAANKTQAVFGDVNDRAKSAMEKSSKMFEEMNAFGKGNVEALVESSRIAAKGLETLGQDAAEFTRKQFESTTAMMKSLASVKSPTELFKMQSDFVRQSFDSVVAESSKNTEALLKLVGEIAQPLSNRVALAAEKAKIAA